LKSMEQSNILFAFGLREGKVVHISKVKSGLSCDCFCPSCGAQLIARKGNVRRHHFAHEVEECAHGAETALHMAGKDILEKNKYIKLPPVRVVHPNNPKKHRVIYDEKKIFAEKVIVEKKFGEIVPDVLFYYNNVPLIIEIVVAHDVNSEKLSKIQKMGISALKIDLSKIKRSFDYEALTHNIIEQTHHKTWLYNVKALKFMEDFYTHVEKKPIKEEENILFVEDCPLISTQLKGKRKAYLEEECRVCKYQISINMNSYIFGWRAVGVLECSGKSKKHL